MSVTLFCHQVSTCLCRALSLWLFSLPPSSSPTENLPPSFADGSHCPHSRIWHSIAPSHIFLLPLYYSPDTDHLFSPTFWGLDADDFPYLLHLGCLLSPSHPLLLSYNTFSSSTIERSGEEAQDLGGRGPPWTQERTVGSSLRIPWLAHWGGKDMVTCTTHGETCLRGETHLRLERPCVGATHLRA